MADAKNMDAAQRLTVDLAGQVAIVTGASRWLGGGDCPESSPLAAKVACLARSVDKLAQTVASITDAGGMAEAVACDVLDGASVQTAVDGVFEKWGRLDILVNNAGITRDTLIPRMSDEQWDEVIATNLRGPFLVTRAATRPLLQQRYGRIINIASVSGLMGNPGQANYSASKAGLIGMTATVAKELASRKADGQCGRTRLHRNRDDRRAGTADFGSCWWHCVPAKRMGTPWTWRLACCFWPARLPAISPGKC